MGGVSSIPSERYAGAYEMPNESDETTGSWTKLRRLVFLRDKAQCHVCCARVHMPGNYECGHIVDRSNGGFDKLSNLVAMCRTCNRVKPSHDTREEYSEWLYKMGEVVRHARIRLGSPFAVKP